MQELLQDIRFALRTLQKSPGFTAIAVVTIGLGIGAGSAVFSMVEGVLLRRLPYAGNDRLVQVIQGSGTASDAYFSVPEVVDYRGQVKKFDMVAEYHSMPFTMYGIGEPERVQVGVVSDNFFNLLGTPALLGRTFTPGEEDVGVAPVIVLSYAYWQNHFGGDSKIVGKTFTMNDKVHTIVGVLPPLPPYPDRNDMWMPAGACPFRSAPSMMHLRAGRMLSMFARLGPGATVAGAQAEINTVASRLHATYPEAYPAEQRFQNTTFTLRDQLTKASRPLFFSLLTMAAFVLLIAAVNFANLTLSRQLRRARELALRSALGAARGRIYRQLATESLIVTLTGAVLGIAIAESSLGLLRAFASRITPRGDEITIDPLVLAFAIGTSICVGLLAALVPLLQVRKSLVDRLRSSSATTSNKSDGRLRNMLVASQVGVAFTLLVVAGLMVRSLVKLERVDGGYDPNRVMTAAVDLNWSIYTNGPSIHNFVTQLSDRLATQPGVIAVAVANDFPLNTGTPNSYPFQIDGVSTPPEQVGPHSDVALVSEDYFKAIGVPILQGRAFAPTDHDTTNFPVIISHRFAQTYWPQGGALGARLSSDSGAHWSTIVGIVGDVRQNTLSQDVTNEVYYPLLATSSQVTPTGLRVIVRATKDPSTLAKAIRDAVHSIDPKQPVSSVQTLSALRGEQLVQPQVTAVLLVAFALLAVAITAGGLGGVVATTVGQRVNEIGIRLALGATNGSIVAMVVRGGIGIVIVGLGLGVLGALLATRVVAQILFDVAPTDPVTYVGVALALVGVAAVACMIPALGALRIDPIDALRNR